MRYLPPKGTAGLAVTGERSRVLHLQPSRCREFRLHAGLLSGTMPSALRRVALMFSARAGAQIVNGSILYRLSEQCMLRFVHEENAKPGARSVMHRVEPYSDHACGETPRQHCATAHPF